MNLFDHAGVFADNDINLIDYVSVVVVVNDEINLIDHVSFL